MFVCYCSSCNYIVHDNSSSSEYRPVASFMSTALTGDPPHSRFQAGTHRKVSQRWIKTASSSEQHYTATLRARGPVTIKMATDPSSQAQRAQQFHSHHEEQSFKNQWEQHKKLLLRIHDSVTKV